VRVLKLTVFVILICHNTFFFSHLLHLQLIFHCPIYGLPNTPNTFILKTATAVFVETLENLQHSAQIIPESWRYIDNQSPPSPPVALQSLKDLGRLTYRRFLELFRHMVELLERVISPSQGLYLHRTTQHRNTRTNIHALSGIRAHDPSNQPAKTHASDRTATVTGLVFLTRRK
jgi:hypothetical protein